jgi:hypothetical protein
VIFGLFGRRKKRASRTHRAADGVEWGVEVRTPSATNAMVVFHYPDPTTTALDRYAWWVSDGPKARDVTARLTADEVLASLTDDDLRAVFRKSMPISSQIPRFEPA